jgi:hypothetical protein
MNPAFRPPPDSTRREAEATIRDSGPKCPFYGASIHWGRLIVVGRNVNEAYLPSNQCALITSAHSPCWMEVGESRPPDWAACPRNPEFAAPGILCQVPVGQLSVIGRVIMQATELVRLTRKRDAAELEGEHGPRGRCGGGIE